MNTIEETKSQKTCCGPDCCSDETTETTVLENPVVGVVTNNINTDLTKEKTEEELKQIVKEQYSQIALQSKELNESSCWLNIFMLRW